MCHFKPTNECGLGYKPGLPFTCDVVEVVETVEVKAAGFLFGRVWTLSSHAGGSDGVCCPHSIVTSGTGLEQRLPIKNLSH